MVKYIPNKENSNQDNSKILYQDIKIKDGFYYAIVQPKNDNTYIEVPLGNMVLLNRKLVNLNDYSQYFELSFIDSSGAKYEGLIVPREIIADKKKILELAKNGVMTDEKKSVYLSHSILNQELLLEKPTEYIHSKLGFSTFDNKMVFLGDRGYNINSEYNGDMQIAPAGSYKQWIKMIKNEIEGHTPMETIFSIAVAGVFKDYLKDKIELTNPFAHLIGDSSSGKTTAGLLAVSMGASPNIADNSFVHTCDSTTNAIMRSINSSFPMLLDEGAQLRGDKTSFLYSVANGKERSRLTKDIMMQTTNVFHTSIFITSERSILDECQDNNGLRVRVLEFINVKWTKSAESSERIKEVCKNNYGFALPKIAEYLLSDDMEGNVKWFFEQRECLVKLLKKRSEYNQFSERLCGTYSLIICASQIANEVFGLNFDSDKIVDFLFEHNLLKSEETADLGVRAYNYIIEYVNLHLNEFPKTAKAHASTESEYNQKKFSIKGKIQDKKLYIAESSFKAILNEGRFSDSKIVVEKLRNKNLLITTEKDRPSSRFVLTEGGGKIKGYILKMQETQTENNFLKFD